MLLSEMSDEDLIFLIDAGSKMAERVFYLRYSIYSQKIAKDYYYEFKDSGISLEDFYAVAFAKTFTAVASYKKVKKSFYSFWKVVVKNAIYDYVRDNSYQLGAKALSGTSLDDVPYEDNDSIRFHDILAEEDSDNAIKEILKEYINSDNCTLTEEEKIIVKLLYIEELSLKEIIEESHLMRNRVNYLIRTSRKKIQKIIKENYL